MENQSSKWLIFIGSLVVAFFFVWFGLRLLTLDTTIGSSAFYLLGVASILAGIFSLTSGSRVQILVCVSLILVGLYFIARGNGQINYEWLARLTGLATFFAAGLLLFVTLPKSDNI